MVNYLARYLDKRRQKRIQSIKERFPDQVRQIELVAKYNSKLDRSDIERYTCLLENRPSPKTRTVLICLGVVGIAIGSQGFIGTYQSGHKITSYILAGLATVSCGLEACLGWKAASRELKFWQYGRERGRALANLIDSAYNHPERFSDRLKQDEMKSLTMNFEELH